MKQTVRHEGGMGLMGTVQVEVRRHGRVIGVQRQPNLVTREGRRLIMHRAADLPGDPISHLAVGTGLSPARAGNTSLENEVYRDVLTGVESPSAGELVSRLFIPTHAANGHEIWEAGLFNASTGGTMYARTVFSESIDKNDQITLQITWTHTLNTR